MALISLRLRSVDRVRRARSERQGNAGAAAARASRSRPAIASSRSRFRTTPRTIGQEIRAGLSTRSYPADVMQLLFIANRHERRTRSEQWLADGVVVICDRYLASSVAYGEALGLERRLADRHAALPAAAGADDPARHRARDGAGAQSGGTRSLRERSGAARARARQLSRPREAAAELGDVRRRAVARRGAAEISETVASRLALP